MHAVKKTATTPSGGLGALGKLKAERGFKAGVSGAHTARTMMLADLSTLLEAAPAEAKRQDFNRLIVEENILGKRTTSNRHLIASSSVDLYSLVPRRTGSPPIEAQ